MCLIRTTHYVCGHSYDTEIRWCLKYKEMTEKGPLLCKLLCRARSTCGKNIQLPEDVRTACSPLCTKILHQKWKKHDKDLEKQEKHRQKREQERLERARAVAREYRKNKQKEEEALQRQKEERERKEQREREKERKRKSKEAPAKKDIRPLWQTARGGTDMRTMGPSRPEVRHTVPPARTEPQRAPHRLADQKVHSDMYQVLTSPRVEAQHAPPRLADRQVLPQAYHPQNNPGPQAPRTQTNLNPPGRHPQVAHSQPSMPFASSTNHTGSSLARRTHHRVGHHQEGTLEDPRVRIQAQQTAQRNGLAQRQAQRSPAQTVASHRPVKVSTPPDLAQPSLARVSAATTSWPSPPQQQPRHPEYPGQSSTARTSGKTAASPPSRRQYQPRPLAPNLEGYRPPVPPKDPWRPQHPNLAPPPLSLRQRGPGNRTVRTPEQQPGGGGTTAFNGYRPDPTRKIPNRKPVPVSHNSPPSRGQGQGPSEPGAGYRPNPMFANKQDNIQKPAPAGAGGKPEKKKGKWFKKLIGQGSMETVSSVEWVSEDAARIERGE